MDARLATAIEDHPLWYHSIELGPGCVTRGWFDLRPIVEKMPWPDVRGKRCLDIGTWDGFLAFELERRGASEVVATDIASNRDWDFLPRDRAAGIAKLDEMSTEKGRGFLLAVEALGSRVHRETINVYDLSPERIGGTFDVVVCGSLLLHLRDPFRALAAIRSVCADQFLSAEQIDLTTTVLHRRRPVLRGQGTTGQWLIPNATGHAWMLKVAGFDVVRRTKPYAIPFGPGHPLRTGLRSAATSAFRRAVAGNEGVPHAAVLAKRAPAID
jgi:tRNA (mo5U34)-methyltransferase